MSGAVEGIDSWNIKEKTDGIWHLPCLRTVSRYILLNDFQQDAYSEIVLRFIPERNNINSFPTESLRLLFYGCCWLNIHNSLSSIVLLFTNATSKYNNDHMLWLFILHFNVVNLQYGVFQVHLLSEPARWWCNLWVRSPGL